MKTFEELKKELLDLAKSKNACEDGYKMGLLCKSKKDLLIAITSNWWWVLSESKMIDSTFLEANFTAEELKNAGILVSGNHEAHNETFFACGSSTVEAYDSSTVEAYGLSYVNDFTGEVKNVSDSGIIRDYFRKKIYIKKGNFEIIEIK